MNHKNASPYDPRGIISESYVLEGLSDTEARAIFLDWAMMDAGDAPVEAMRELLDKFEAEYPEHPMTALLREGVSQPLNKRGRKGRRSKPSN